MDEPPLVNGRVSSRELYAAISSLRVELASAQRAQAGMRLTSLRLKPSMPRARTSSSTQRVLMPPR